jgi:2-keto-4-pentenoate hydratase/2-oxohepta-3-ene-1,7-dioic acid hydratase in catechol pathway
MRLVTYEHNGRRSIGVLHDAKVIDLPTASGGALPGDMLALLQAGETALAQAQHLTAQTPGTVPLAEVQLKAPVPRPGKIVGIGLNYRDHASEGGREIPKYPMIFVKMASAVIADGEAIRIPAVTQAVDFEGELAVVIGRRAKGVSSEDAFRYVAGYTICNDVSARDYQQRSSPTAGKSFDTFAPLGPVLLTRDEVPDQQSNTRHLIFDIPYLIEYLSHIFALEPGDVITTGTPAGVGVFCTPPRFLRAGDTVRIEVQGVGVLQNPVTEG